MHHVPRPGRLQQRARLADPVGPGLLRLQQPLRERADRDPDRYVLDQPRAQARPVRVDRTARRGRPAARSPHGPVERDRRVGRGAGDGDLGGGRRPVPPRTGLVQACGQPGAHLVRSGEPGYVARRVGEDVGGERLDAAGRVPLGGIDGVQHLDGAFQPVECSDQGGAVNRPGTVRRVRRPLRFGRLGEHRLDPGPPVLPPRRPVRRLTVTRHPQGGQAFGQLPQPRPRHPGRGRRSRRTGRPRRRLLRRHRLGRYLGQDQPLGRIERRQSQCGHRAAWIATVPAGRPFGQTRPPRGPLVPPVRTVHLRRPQPEVMTGRIRAVLRRGPPGQQSVRLRSGLLSPRPGGAVHDGGRHRGRRPFACGAGPDDPHGRASSPVPFDRGPLPRGGGLARASLRRLRRPLGLRQPVLRLRPGQQRLRLGRSPARRHHLRATGTGTVQRVPLPLGPRETRAQGREHVALGQTRRDAADRLRGGDDPGCLVGHRARYPEGRLGGLRAGHAHQEVVIHLPAAQPRQPVPQVRGDLAVVAPHRHLDELRVQVRLLPDGGVSELAQAFDVPARPHLVAERQGTVPVPHGTGGRVVEAPLVVGHEIGQPRGEASLVPGPGAARRPGARPPGAGVARIRDQRDEQVAVGVEDQSQVSGRARRHERRDLHLGRFAGHAHHPHPHLLRGARHPPRRPIHGRRPVHRRTGPPLPVLHA